LGTRRGKAVIGTLAAARVIYRIRDDGKLTFVRKDHVDTGKLMQFWSGIVAPA
jgi:hypothetical protein